MHKSRILLAAIVIVTLVTAITVVPQLFEDAPPPTMRWSSDDELEVVTDGEADQEQSGADAFERAEAGLGDGTAAAATAGTDDRIDLVLRGRIVDKWLQPVAGARVWLEFGRGGQRGPANRQRRLPEPVISDEQGRFAFAGQTFRRLRVNLQVKGPRHALALFDRDLGTVSEAAELGDLVVESGGSVRGRVTDLEGNGIAGAELRLNPENRNAMRMLRDRDDLLPPATTDRSGFYVLEHIAAGDWSLQATAKRHTEGRSEGFTVELDQPTDVADIRLGPGYELTGIVRDPTGKPIAKAAVSLQAERTRPAADNEGRPSEGRGAMARVAFGRGREHRTETDAEGHFGFEHLPGVAMTLDVRAQGFLDHESEGIDPTIGRPIEVTMQEGLRITGRVRNPDGSPVTLFAVRAIRLRGLPSGDLPPVDVGAIMAQMRDGSIDDATRAQLRQTMEQFRGQFDRGGRGDPDRGGPDRGGRGGPEPNRNLGRPERHPDGAFALTGLQEGVYEVHVQSNEHARYQSAELEVQSGTAAHQLEVTLDPGVYVAGAVLDDRGMPVARATVQLSTANAFDNMRRGGRQNGFDIGNVDVNRMAREVARQFGGARVTLEARTDDDGIFVIKHVARGTYVLRAEADGYADTSLEAFGLENDRSGVELRLGLLGRITGMVTGLREGEAAQARIAAIPVGGGGGFGALFGRGRGGNPFAPSEIDPDGSFEIAGLAPGDYLVRAWLGTPEQLMRELGPQFFGGTITADTTVRGGEATRLDVALTRPQLGTITGTVTLNGVPGAGLQVSLQREDTGQAQNGGAPMGRGGRGGGFTMGLGGNTATVAASGRFTLKDVPAGNYRLQVRPARRGGTLHEQPVFVTANGSFDLSIYVTTARLDGSLTRDDGAPTDTVAGRASLLPGLTAVPENVGQYLRQNPGFDARIEKGTFSFEALPLGNYVLVVQPRGHGQTALPITVAGDQTVSLPLGAASQPNVPPGGAPR
jgi:protocatechuate 3,4-dioxygenase beta subunit